MTQQETESWCQSLTVGDRVAIHKSDTDEIEQGDVMDSWPSEYIRIDAHRPYPNDTMLIFRRDRGWNTLGYYIRPID